jgi:hypothetical protein
MTRMSSQSYSSINYTDGFRDGERGLPYSPPAFTLHCQEYTRGYIDGSGKVPAGIDPAFYGYAA